MTTTRIRHIFATILRRYAQIRDAFAKVLDSSFADSRRIRESSRRIRDRFGQVRASSRKFAQVRASSRRIRGFATHSRIRASSRKFATGSRGFATDSRRIRDGFAPSSHGFATGLRKFATDSRRVRTSSHKFAPDVTQFRDANVRRGHVTSPICTNPRCPPSRLPHVHRERASLKPHASRMQNVGFNVL